MANHRDAHRPDTHVGGMDPVALVEALLGRKLDRSAVASSALEDAQSDYDTLADLEEETKISAEFDSQAPRPDEQPKNLRVGCINPYALVEALVGQKMDRCSIGAARIISDALATDYDELFDMKHRSVLYAGLKLGGGGGQERAEELGEKDIGILDERDLVSPDLSRVTRVGDIEKLGLKDVMQARVTMARLQNGKLHMVLQARDVAKSVSNCDVTETINELCLPFRNKRKNRDRRRRRSEQWSPPNSSWSDMYQSLYQSMARRMFMGMGMEMLGLGDRLLLGRQQQHMLVGGSRFDDPVQGAMGNSWFVAALFSVFWADPHMINRSVEIPGHNGHDRDRNNSHQDERSCKLSVKFHDKGGESNNNKTSTVSVDYCIPINNSDGQPVYCRSSSGCALWPSLYEKAFAKWVTNDSSERPDMTHLHSGDPIKAMAQINGRTPEYYFTDRRSGQELVGLVRSCSINFKTISPMCAYTRPSGDMCRGSNLAANHAYSVLGWAELAQRQHLIVRNPWGVTEHPGLTSYTGVLDRVEADFWSPATMLDCGGVMAIEPEAFKQYFACIGVAKLEGRNDNWEMPAFADWGKRGHRHWEVIS